MEIEEVSKYYDDFVPGQAAIAVNERIFSLFQRIKKEGLKTNSNILELGCGVGAFTFLLSTVVKKGTVEAIDISPQSVAYAKGKIKNRNIQFETGDIVLYKPH